MLDREPTESARPLRGEFFIKLTNPRDQERGPGAGGWALLACGIPVMSIPQNCGIVIMTS